jgi:hypothetical protein
VVSAPWRQQLRPAGARAELAEVGAVHLPAVLDAGWCARLHASIERCRSAPSPHYGVLSRPGDAVVDSDLFRWFDDPDVRAVTHAGPLPTLAADLLDAEEVVLVEDQWFSSAPGATTATPWHQDDPYYNIDVPFLTIWVALDPTPRGAGLRVVPGSHRWGKSFAPVEFVSSGATIGPGAGLEAVPDVEADLEAFRVRGWDVPAGDVIALDSRTLHAAGGAAVGTQPFRRLSVRYAAGTARYVERGPQVASFWAMLGHGLEPGDRLAGEVFPVVWRRPSTW